ncbi:toprim domain-containing protein [Chryseobacterium turcicum]|uniref:Toprim domain-containing protein n=1 Tax=Chryseobacterium turcicum TaxID=2898076 RepID=A0A9Q3V4A3_9FLAO|nr:toprim domain-containing protein [Chryseobacterium turcicum]MCD1118102.1 toprim domain-containing protein [Chryseobacterium turcicum]
MNIQQAKNISIKSIMESFSLFPSKGNDRTAFYFALDREERTPSLSVNFVGNTAFDFGTGKKFDNVSLVQAIKQCSVSDALKYLAGLDYAFIKEEITAKRETSFEISAIKDLQHPALIQYLDSRNINFKTNYLREIHYEISGKKYFGIAFENNSGGFEIRNKYAKLCLGKKNISTFENNSSTLQIFEGFMDFMSFKNMDEIFGNPSADYAVLNSISLTYLLEKMIKKYEKVELYLDNDNAGDKGTIELKNIFPNANDQRGLYKEFKDINDFLMSR